MYRNQSTIAQDVKREVLAELRQSGSGEAPHFRGSPGGSGRNAPGYWDGYSPYTEDNIYRTIKDSVKNEILSDIQLQQGEQLAKSLGLHRSLSDQKIQQMIDARYRTIDNMKEDIKKGLAALQILEGQPYTGQIAGILAEESQRQGVPLDQVMQGLEKKSSSGAGVLGKVMEILNKGQRKGFLCGIGSSFLFYLLTSGRSGMQSVAVRSLEEGMSMVDKAKSFVSGQQPQPCPPPPVSTDFSNMDPVPPVPPTDGNLPPDGGGTLQ
ncbi:MAG: hypothetical protein GX318_07270 [Clostridia bacterium]|nr:hypothetical protein [Clostridia bacterium]